MARWGQGLPAALSTAVLLASLALPACSREATVKSSAASGKADWSVEVGAGDKKSGDAPVSSPQITAGSPEQAGPRGVQVEGYSDSVRPTATLPGFHILSDGRSRVFVEVIGKVPVREARAEGVLFYRFTGVRVPERVNRMSLPTTYFDSPVNRISMIQVDDDADLVIELRSPAKAKSLIRTTPFATVLSVDFPRPEPILSERSAGDDQQVVRPTSDTNWRATGTKKSRLSPRALAPSTEWVTVSAEDEPALVPGDDPDETDRSKGAEGALDQRH